MIGAPMNKDSVTRTSDTKARETFMEKSPYFSATIVGDFFPNPARKQTNTETESNRRPYCFKANKGFRTMEILLQEKARKIINKIAKKSKKIQNLTPPVIEPQCEVCYRTFGSDFGLMQHLRVRHKAVYLQRLANRATENKALEQRAKGKDDMQPYVCVFCDASFNSSVDFNIHLLTHKPEKGQQRWDRKYKCKTCDESFIKKFDLDTHEISQHHVEQQQFQCDVCLEYFEFKSYLENHKVIHEQNKDKMICSCEICGKTFGKNFSVLERHLLVHIGERKHQCSICNKSFVLASELNNHMKCHDSIKEFRIQCEVCGARFRDHSNFRQHRRTHSRKFKFVCRICGEGFNENFYLVQHKKSHTKEELKQVSQFQCDLCNKHFMSKNSLRTHRNIHMGLRPFSCRYCDKTFTQRPHRKEHELRHMGKKPFQCHTCGMGYFNKLELRHHVNKMHSGDQLWKCNLCEKLFETSTSFKLHMNNEHSADRIRCTFCDEVFQSKRARAAHEKDHHSDEFPFRCEICDKTFQFSFRLKMHSTQHISTRSFKCSLCSKMFKTSHARKLHVYHRHVRTKPFVCETCGRAFSIESAFLKHRENHIETKVFPCSVCIEAFSTEEEYEQHALMHSILSSSEPFEGP